MPTDLSKLNNVVNNDAVKKKKKKLCMINWLLRLTPLMLVDLF